MRSSGFTEGNCPGHKAVFFVYKAKWEPEFSVFRGGSKNMMPNWMILIHSLETMENFIFMLRPRRI